MKLQWALGQLTAIAGKILHLGLHLVLWPDQTFHHASHSSIRNSVVLLVWQQLEAHARSLAYVASKKPHSKTHIRRYLQTRPPADNCPSTHQVPPSYLKNYSKL